MMARSMLTGLYSACVILQTVGCFSRSRVFKHKLIFNRALWSSLGNNLPDVLASDSIDSKPLSDWNIKGLKNEVSRLHTRTFKKVSKANEKLSAAETVYNSIKNNPSPSLDQLEQCPDIDLLRSELANLQQRLGNLDDLGKQLESIKSTSDQKFPEVVEFAKLLNVSDVRPAPVPRGPKKAKQKPAAPRKPYLTFLSQEGVEIRVGRGASDNDLLSCDAEHRDPADWWLHTSGCAGSHVVIRCTDDDVPTRLRATAVADAALLAAVNSKARQAGKVKVSLTRCRNVSKPKGAKPGLVFLSGEIISVTVDLKAEGVRLERLNQQRESSS